MSSDIRALRASALVISPSVRVSPLVVLEALSRLISKADILTLGLLERSTSYSVAVKTPAHAERLLAASPVSAGSVQLDVLPASVRRFVVRLHGLPAFTTIRCVSTFLTTFGKVSKVGRLHFQEAGFTHISNGIFEAVVEAKDINDLPHTARFPVGDETFTVVITSPQRRPRCFRCRQEGHTRQQCTTAWCARCRLHGSHATANCPSAPPEPSIQSDSPQQWSDFPTLSEASQAPLVHAAVRDTGLDSSAPSLSVSGSSFANGGSPPPATPESTLDGSLIIAESPLSTPVDLATESVARRAANMALEGDTFLDLITPEVVPTYAGAVRSEPSSPTRSSSPSLGSSSMSCSRDFIPPSPSRDVISPTPSPLRKRVASGSDEPAKRPKDGATVGRHNMPIQLPR